IVLRLNGDTVKDSVDLTRRVGMARAGDILRLDILRDGRPQTIQVRSGTRPSESELLARARGGADNDNDETAEPEPTAGGALFIGGLYVAPVDSATRRRFSLEAGVNGLVVTAVQPGSAAARGDFRPGMVVTRVDNKAVSSLAE